MPEPFSTFYSRPEYRAKHDAYMRTRVPCKYCDSVQARNNMSHHRKTMRCREIKMKRQNNRFLNEPAPLPNI